MANNMNSSHPNTPTQAHLESHVLPLKLYFRIFGLLTALFFVNIFIYLSGVGSPYSIILLLSVSGVQTLLVVLFFMELVHEEKFYFFIFVSCILFIILFLFVSLAEIGTRNFFHPAESVHMLRGVDQQGSYAPAGPTEKNHSPFAESVETN